MDKRERRRRKRAQEKLEGQFKRSKSIEDTQPNRGATQQPQEKRFLSKTVSTANTFWGAVAIILALLGGYAAVKPVVHVDPYIQLDPDTPFSERFKVSNDGLFAIHDVDFGCSIAKATFLNNQLPAGQVVGIHILLPDNYRKVIEAAGSTTVDCPLSDIVNFAGVKYDSAEIQFTVAFRPTLYPWRKERNVRFHGQLDSQGKVRWLY